MKAIKCVKQEYALTEEINFLLSSFRDMVNQCLKIGIESNLTSMKSLSMKAYHNIDYKGYTAYKLCAISATAGILSNYRKALRKAMKKDRTINVPHASRLLLKTSYGFKIEKNILKLPRGDRTYIEIPLNHHTIAELSQDGVQANNITLTEKELIISYSKEVQEIAPKAIVGIDRNLENITTSGSHIQKYDISEIPQMKQTYKQIKASFKRNDHRIRKKIYTKYGKRQTERTKQILHEVSKCIVAEAKATDSAIAMENIKDIRNLYQKGNGQGRNYRGRMQGWQYGEIQRQVEYKARWEGIPTIYINARGTSSNCSICGERLSPNVQRSLQCMNCGIIIDRDVNASINIQNKGLAWLASSKGIVGEAVIRNPVNAIRQEVIQ